MLKTERKKLILEELRKHKVVSLEKLVGLLDTSESTVRRDLDELESENKLRRVHGEQSCLTPCKKKKLFKRNLSKTFKRKS